MGGRAFKDLTRRVSLQEVYGTVGWLQANLNLKNFGGKPFSDCLLGSAGKKATSGDIDINVDRDCSDINAATIELQNLLGANHVWLRSGNNQIFCAVPINGDPTQGRVQVDFMFGIFAWQRFSYASPGEDSAYKGLYRTELLKALTAAKSDWTLMENDELVARVGPTFFDSKGLIWRYRHRPFGKKDPTKRIKAFQELGEEEFMQLYPDANEVHCWRMTHPEEVVDFLFAGCATMAETYSYETLSFAMFRIYAREFRRLVNKLYLERLTSLKVDIPDAIRTGLN